MPDTTSDGVAALEAVTKEGVEALDLEPGSAVTVLVKATEVMLATE